MLNCETHCIELIWSQYFNCLIWYTYILPHILILTKALWLRLTDSWYACRHWIFQHTAKIQPRRVQRNLTMNLLNTCETVFHTLKTPATDRVRLDVCVTTKNSATSMQNAKTAPATICSNMTTTTTISWLLKNLHLVTSASPTRTIQIY